VTLRAIGYAVSYGQIFWPPAWSQFHRLQARLFADRARQQLARGQTREAMAALVEAGRLDSDNFEVNFTLARLTQAIDPLRAWQIYQHLLVVQPGHHDEIAQTAGRALLVAGLWDPLAGLARQELVRGAPGEGAWLQAITAAARFRHRPDWLAQAASAAPSAELRGNLSFLARVIGAENPVERYQLLTSGRPEPLLPFVRLFCAQELIGLKRTDDAIALVNDPAARLSGRDTARLLLAAHSQAGDRQWVREQFAALLRLDRQLRAAELELLALHLLEWPDADGLQQLVSSHTRIHLDIPAARLSAEVTLYCLVRLQGSQIQQNAVKNTLYAELGSLAGTLGRLDQGGAEKLDKRLNINTLSEFPAVPVELLYFLRAKLI
jgi:hypothetical protein